MEEAAIESGLSSPRPAPVATTSQQHENRLVQARAGIASSLFSALKYKHPPSADHCLRVALGCSSWALFAKLDEETHDTVELAALMHDLGKISVPDAILQKPGRLTSEEKAVVDRHRDAALDMLAHCCGSERVLNAVRYSGTRFDGQGSTLPAKESTIPLEARMIAIVDAFDWMTTDHMHRSAMSRERALKQLFEEAGSQFDPGLVKQFVEALSQRQDMLSSQVASRWLNGFSSSEPGLPWQPSSETTANAASPAAPVSSDRSLFEQKLLDAMYDGVVFVDAQCKITLWSKGTQRLTGVDSSAATGRIFIPSLLQTYSHGGRKMRDDACPVAKAIRTSTQLRQRVEVMGRQGKHVAIDLHAIPVHGADGTIQGATVLLHDAQGEASLEEKCEALHAEVTKDPMTKVANRAEFDRMLALFIEAHQQAKLPCSLIMCDIDHFKNINDTYGHQAGDEAIITMATLLTTMCRSGDLVARYGGEEFVVICADCSNADAARRAEQIRRKLSETPHACLGNKRIMASFGVTELQSGDTPETMLRRSDRALLQAKEQGRNQVVQLGDGMEKKKKNKKKKWWPFARRRGKPVVEMDLVTAVPIDIAIEKLRGFVSDHQAKILSTRENKVDLQVSSEHVSYNRRKKDRHVIFRVELQFDEERVERTNNLGFASGEYAQTRVRLKIQPQRASRGRRTDITERARLIMQSLKAYLMAEEEGEESASLAALEVPS